MVHPAQYGSRDCAAEILIQASTRIGRPIHKGPGLPKPIQPMDVVDAIADVCTNNPQGALDALAELHRATQAADLRAWQSGHSDAEVAVLLRQIARGME